MGWFVLIRRLVVADLRRHPRQAVIFLLALVAASTTVAVGLTVDGVTGSLYGLTRAATAGPDVVAFAPDLSPDDARALAALDHGPGVVGHSGPYPAVTTMLTAHGRTVRATAEGAATTPGPVDRPLVTSGHWVRTGGVVVERGFAEAIGVHVGDRVTIAGRAIPVVGIAVTAADGAYPWAEVGPGPNDSSGRIWLTTQEVQALGTADGYVLDLTLADPAATDAFVHHYHATTLYFQTWQLNGRQDAVLLRDSSNALNVGSWLLGFLAISGVAGLVATRSSQQTRRAGLLKAAGAAPGMIAAVLLAEYLALGLLAAVAGLAVAWAICPYLDNPSASLLTAHTLPISAAAWVIVLVLAVAVLTALGPAVRALRTDTVHALGGTVRRAPFRVPLASALPTSLLFGLLLIGRRPGRAVVQLASIAATLTIVTALLVYEDEPVRLFDLGATSLPNLGADEGHHVAFAVAGLGVALAVLNILIASWSAALDAQRASAIARTLGATPGQVAAGLSVTQLLPAVPGAILGVGLGVSVIELLAAPNAQIDLALPRLLAIALGTLVTVAVLTAVPARAAARRSLAGALSAEAT